MSILKTGLFHWMASNKLLSFIWTLLTVSLKASGHETTSYPFILTQSVSDTSFDNLVSGRGVTFSTKTRTISVTADVPGRDDVGTRSSSSYLPTDEWFSPISEQRTVPTMGSPEQQLMTNTTSDQLLAGMATLVNFQCDVVLYKCSLRPSVANKSTGTLFENSADEEFAGMAIRPEEKQCLETLSQKAHVTVSSVSNLKNFHLDFAFLQSCPPGYSNDKISELCRNPWNNQQNQTRRQFFLPVMSTQENLTAIASNIYCSLCNGFKAIEPINVTFLCGDEMTKHDVHTSALNNCKAVLSIRVGQSLIHFPYSLVKGLIHDETKETDKSQTGTTSDIFTAENATSHDVPLLEYDLRQLKNCLSDVAPSVNDPTGPVQTKVEFLINSNAMKQNSKESKCDESTGLPFKLRVCFKFSSSFADMKQAFVLSYEDMRKDGQELIPETFASMTECVSALTSHFSDFVTHVSRLESHPTNYSNSSLLSVKVTYSKRVFPVDVFQAVGKLKPELLPGCNLLYFSELNRCLPGHTASINVLLAESFVIKYPNETNLAIPNPDPCSEKLTPFTKAENSQRTLTCKGYLLVSMEDITRLNKSNAFHLDETYIQRVNGEVWICTEYLDQINTARTVPRQEDSTDEGQCFATVICISVSLGALFVTFLFKIAGNKPNNFPMKIMLNIMASLFMSQLLLLLMNTSHPFICTTVAILSHYFWLSTFAWKLVCSVHMYKTFCKTQYSSSSGVSDTSRRTMICLCIGYGAPLFIVLPTVVIHFCSCTEFVIGYGVRGCFISQPMVNLVTFAAPIGLCILMNMGLFARTIFQIHITSISVPCNHQTTTISSFRIFMKILSLSGFTWIFGYVGIVTNSSVVWYIFTILTCLQGVYIFMAFGLKDIQLVCRKMSKFANSNIQDPTSSQSTETLSCNSTKL